MELTKDEKFDIRKINSILELHLIIIKKFNIEYQWISNIKDTELLKDLICFQLFEIINLILIDIELSNKTNTKGLGEKTIQKLYNCKVFNQEKFDILIQLKMRKKPTNVKGNHSHMCRPKKRRQKKAVS
jgi:hypothetical protein